MKNVGKTDKVIRILLALVIGVLYSTNILKGTIAYIAIAVAVILLVTGFINFCPLYKILGLKSTKDN